jgi:protein SEY1
MTLQTFEQTTSLFALAMADVLLINMWTNDVGRYGASNYGLLKVIFEVNLKLFEQQAAKKLLFVLRDFDDRGNNGDRIKIILENDIRRIWQEIYKPDKFRDSTPDQFFQFEFAMMPHKIFEEQKFYDEAKKLRARFEIGAANSLFLSDAEQKNIPMDGVSIFIERSWAVIRSQKELNLPDQRDMVANYRCNEIKEEAEKLVQPKMESLLHESSEKEITTFKETVVAILGEAVQHY